MFEIKRGGPWIFDYQLLLLKHWVIDQKAEVIFNEVFLWVQIRALPLTLSDIGEVVQVETREEEAEGGRYLRVRVRTMADISLQRKGIVKLTDCSSFEVAFKYEKLQRICAWCGFLDHLSSGCTKRQQSVERGEEPWYGDWMFIRENKVEARKGAPVNKVATGGEGKRVLTVEEH